MAKLKPESIDLRVIYDGTGPPSWTGGSGDFGLSGPHHPALRVSKTSPAGGRPKMCRRCHSA